MKHWNFSHKRSVSLTCLAIEFGHRYDQLGATRTRDLEEAIVLTREALDLYPAGHPDRPTSLNTLGVRLTTRYERLGVMEDLHEAIVFHREALDSSI